MWLGSLMYDVAIPVFFGFIQKVKVGLSTYNCEGGLARANCVVVRW